MLFYYKSFFIVATLLLQSLLSLSPHRLRIIAQNNNEIILETISQPLNRFFLPSNLSSSNSFLSQSDTTYVLENCNIGILELDDFPSNAAVGSSFAVRNCEIGSIIVSDHIKGPLRNLKIENNNLGAFRSLNWQSFAVLNVSISNNIFDADSFLLPRFAQSDSLKTTFEDRWNTVRSGEYQLAFGADLANVASSFPQEEDKQSLHISYNTFLWRNRDSIVNILQTEKYFPYGPLGLGSQDDTNTAHLRHLFVTHNNISMIEFNMPSKTDNRHVELKFMRNFAIEILLFHLERIEIVQIANNSIVIESGAFPLGMRFLYRSVGRGGSSLSTIHDVHAKIYIESNFIRIKGDKYFSVPENYTDPDNPKATVRPILDTVGAIFVEPPFSTTFSSSSYIGRIDHWSVSYNDIDFRVPAYEEPVTRCHSENNFGIVFKMRNDRIGSDTYILATVKHLLMDGNNITVLGMRTGRGFEFLSLRGGPAEPVDHWSFDNNRILARGVERNGGPSKSYEARSRGMLVIVGSLVDANLLSVSGNYVSLPPPPEDYSVENDVGMLYDHYAIQFATDEPDRKTGDSWRGLQNIKRVQMDRNEVHIFSYMMAVGLLFDTFDPRSVDVISFSNNTFNLTGHVIDPRRSDGYKEFGSTIEAMRIIYNPSSFGESGWYEIMNNNITVTCLLFDTSASAVDKQGMAAAIRIFAAVNADVDKLFTNYNYSNTGVRNKNGFLRDLTQNSRGIRTYNNRAVMHAEVTDSLLSLAGCYQLTFFQNYLNVGEFDFVGNNCVLKKWARSSTAFGTSGFVVGYGDKVLGVGRLRFENNTIDATDVVADPERRLNPQESVQFLNLCEIFLNPDFKYEIDFTRGEAYIREKIIHVFDAHSFVVKNNTFKIRDSSDPLRITARQSNGEPIYSLESREPQIRHASFVKFEVGSLLRFQHVIFAENTFENNLTVVANRDGHSQTSPPHAFFNVMSSRLAVPNSRGLTAFVVFMHSALSIEKTLNFFKNKITSPFVNIPIFSISNPTEYISGTTCFVSIGQPVYLQNDLTKFVPTPIFDIVNYTTFPATIDNRSEIESMMPVWLRNFVDELEEAAWNYSVSIDDLQNISFENNNTISPFSSASWLHEVSSSAADKNVNTNPLSMQNNDNQDTTTTSQVCENRLRHQHRRHGLYSIGNKILSQDVRPIERDSVLHRSAPSFVFAFANVSLNGSFCSSFDHFSILSGAKSSTNRIPILIQTATPAGAQAVKQTTAHMFTDFIFEKTLIEFVCSHSSSHTRFWYCASLSEADTSYPTFERSNHLVRRLATPTAVLFVNSSVQYSRPTPSWFILGTQAKQQELLNQRGGHFPGISFGWLGIGTISKSSFQKPWLPSSSSSSNYKLSSSIVASSFSENSLVSSPSSVKSSMAFQNSSFVFSGQNVQVGYGDTFGIVPLSTTVNSTGSYFIVEADTRLNVQGNGEIVGKLPLITMTLDTIVADAKDATYINDNLLKQANVPGSQLASLISPYQLYRMFWWESTEILFSSSSSSSSSSSFEKEDFTLLHLVKTENLVRYYDSSATPFPIFDPAIRSSWASSNSLSAQVHCFAINSYQERKSSSVFAGLAGTISTDNTGFFEACPYSATASVSESISTVPYCSVFSLSYAGNLLTANEVAEQEYVKVRFFLVPESASYGRNSQQQQTTIEGRPQSDTFTKFSLGVVNMTGDIFVEGYGLDQEDFLPATTTTTTAPSNNNNNNNNFANGNSILDFADVKQKIKSSDKSVAEAVTARIAAERIIEITLKFNRRIDTKKDYSFKVMINPSLLACRQSLMTTTTANPNDSSNKEQQSSSPSANSVFMIDPASVVNPNQDPTTGWYEAPVVIRRRSTALPAGVVETATTIGGISAAFGAISSPLVGTSLGKAGATQAFAECSFSMTEELPFIESPFGWSIGPEWGAYRRGALIGNNLVIIIICLLLSIIAIVRVQASKRRHEKWLRKHKDEMKKHKDVLKQDDSPELERHASLRQIQKLRVEKQTSEPSVMSFRDGIYLAKLPSTLFIPKTILTQGTVSSAFSLIVSGLNSNDTIIGVFFLALEVIFFCWCVKTIFIDVPRTHHWLIYADRPNDMRRFWGESDPNEGRGDADRSTKIIFSDCPQCRPALKQMQMAEETKKREKLLMKQLAQIMKDKKKKQERERRQREEQRKLEEIEASKRRHEEKKRKFLEKSGITPEQSASLSLANTPTSLTPRNKNSPGQPSFESALLSQSQNTNTNNNNHSLTNSLRLGNNMTMSQSLSVNFLDPSAVSSPTPAAGAADPSLLGSPFDDEHAFGNYLNEHQQASSLPRRHPMVRRSVFHKMKTVFVNILLHPYGDWMTIKPKQNNNNNNAGHPQKNNNSGRRSSPSKSSKNNLSRNPTSPPLAPAVGLQQVVNEQEMLANQSFYNAMRGERKQSDKKNSSSRENSPSHSKRFSFRGSDKHYFDQDDKKKTASHKQQKSTLFNNTESPMPLDPTFLPRTSDVYVQNSGRCYYWCVCEYFIIFLMALASGLQTALESCETLQLFVTIINLIPFVFIFSKLPFSDRASNIFSTIASGLIVLMSFVTGIGDVFSNVEWILSLVAGVNVALSYFGMFKSAFDLIILGLTFESWALLPILAGVHLVSHKASPLRRGLSKLFSSKEREKRKLEKEAKQLEQQEERRRLNELIRNSSDVNSGGTSAGEDVMIFDGKNYRLRTTNDLELELLRSSKTTNLENNNNNTTKTESSSSPQTGTSRNLLMYDTPCWDTDGFEDPLLSTPATTTTNTSTIKKQNHQSTEKLITSAAKPHQQSTSSAKVVSFSNNNGSNRDDPKKKAPKLSQRILQQLQPSEKAIEQQRRREQQQGTLVSSSGLVTASSYVLGKNNNTNNNKKPKSSSLYPQSML